QIIEAFIAAARGLAAAHAVGIVHRDFKPTNVMLGDDGRVRVTDFGLAYSGEASPTLEVPGGAPLKLTRTGAVMGTPAYMAPEQFCGHTDHRSDQFALCVALWEALCGQRPYAGQHLDELRKNVTAGARSPVPVDVRLPIWVRRALERGLANDPEDRFPEMEALIAALEADPRPRRRRIVAAGLAVGLVTAAVAWQQLDRRAATQACHDGGARIHTVLKQATRTTIKAAFTATGVPFAQSSFERAMGHMETWAATWEQQHVNTCLSKVRAELPREHAGLQDSCLEDQLARYAGLVDLFGDADTDVVRTAIDATTRLPEPQMCARPEVLATAVSRADSAQAPKIRRELARVEGLADLEERTPLFDSHTEAAEHGMRDVDDQSPDAVATA
ncbi:MAG: protein kinase domain-containing protein, partial [Nannocystaceae bacterium]